MATNWKFDKNSVFTCKDVENKKDVKYMKEIMDDMRDADEIDNAPTMKPFINGQHYDQDKVQVTTISFKYLERLYLLAKASKTHNIDLYIQDDHPLKAVFFDQRQRGGGKGVSDKTDRGKVVIAPLQLDDREKRRERTKLLDAL